MSTWAAVVLYRTLRSKSRAATLIGILTSLAGREEQGENVFYSDESLKGFPYPRLYQRRRAELQATLSIVGAGKKNCNVMEITNGQPCRILCYAEQSNAITR